MGNHDTGQEFDTELGLYNYRARFYDPRLGRFYATDPAGQFASPYLYAGNNPINMVDPDGELIFSAIFAAVTAWIAAHPIATAAIVGGVIGGTANLASNLTNADGSNTTPDQRAASFFIGAGIGALTGAVSGGVAVWAAGSGLGVSSAVAVGAATEGALGSVEGVFTQGLNNVVAGNNFNQGLGEAAGYGALFGAILGGASGGAGKAFRGRFRGYEPIPDANINGIDDVTDLRRFGPHPPSNRNRSRNLAVAHYNIDGQEDTLRALSGQNAPNGFVQPRPLSQRTFRTYGLALRWNGNIPTIVRRAWDSEPTLLEEIASRFGDTSVRGSIDPLVTS